jgi:pSer/pThr/pTyr-binding forkhead associated (FHA) protein
VEIVTYTWAKDSHGLFDYESPHLFTSSFKISGSAQFFRKDNDIFMLDTSSNSSTHPTHPPGFLFEINTESNQESVTPDRYFISSKNSPSTSKTVDLVVRAIKKNGLPAGYELKVGDIIKIGRVKFLVREVKDNNGEITQIKNLQEVGFIPAKPEIEEEEESKGQENNGSEATCRICLISNLYPDPLDNTLVSPCKCKGSCEYVHLKCLKHWIDSKKSTIENSENVCLSFNYKKLSCEICKESLPYTLKLGSQEYDIIDIKKPTNLPYIILEKVENGRENKGLFLVKGTEQEVRLGRGHTHQILVSDISVSRNHSSIHYKDGKFLLFDNNSKFGTLVQVENPVEISPEKTILQCGKTVIIISLKKEEIIAPAVNPTIAEEVLDSPQTPSTTNEQDSEVKISSTGSEPNKKSERRVKKASRRTYLQVEESKEDNEEDFEVGTQDDRSEVTTHLVPDSKKIFKLVKKDMKRGIKESGRKRKEKERRND